MSTGYTKLFNFILKSSVWVGTPKSVKILWITLLAMKDKDGYVRSSFAGLVKESELTEDECSRALAYLMRPDPHSTTKDLDGRRLVEVPELGWRVVTHQKYRDLMMREETLEKDAARKRALRAKGGRSGEQ